MSDWGRDDGRVDGATRSDPPVVSGSECTRPCQGCPLRAALSTPRRTPPGHDASTLEECQRPGERVCAGMRRHGCGPLTAGRPHTHGGGPVDRLITTSYESQACGHREEWTAWPPWPLRRPGDDATAACDQPVSPSLFRRPTTMASKSTRGASLYGSASMDG